MAYLTFDTRFTNECFLFGNGFELLTEEAQENKVKEKLDDAVKDAANKPKGWIANKIYFFRQLYKSYLDKANREHDSGKIGFFKNIARMILSCIDKLAKFLQNATDSGKVERELAAEREERRKKHEAEMGRIKKDAERWRKIGQHYETQAKKLEPLANHLKTHGMDGKDKDGKDAVDHMRDLQKANGKIELKPGEWKEHILTDKDGKKYFDPKYMYARGDFADVMDHIDKMVL